MLVKSDSISKIAIISLEQKLWSYSTNVNESFKNIFKKVFKNIYYPVFYMDKVILNFVMVYINFLKFLLVI